MKRIIALGLLISLFNSLHANDCSNWKLNLNQPSTSLCRPHTLELVVDITHDSLHLDSCKYEWYIKTPSSESYDMFSDKNETSYVFNDAGSYYVYSKVSPNDCSAIHTDTIEINRYEQLIPGTIIGEQTICYNTIPSSLSQSALPTGGDGAYTYAWMQKVEGASEFSYIPGATTTTYAPPALKQTTTYRLEITDNCGTVYSNEQTITVRPALSAPIISDHNETICYETLPTQLSVATSVKGGDDDSFTYQWQESTDNITFTDIEGAIATTYQPSSLKQDHYYRVVATSVQGCGSIYSSNIAKISVLEDLQISTVGTEPLCYMSRGDIKVVATGAGDDYIYQWQESTDSIVFTNCQSNANSETYKTAPLGAGTYYYRCVVSPTYGCAPKTSDVIIVKVYEEVIPCTITGSDTICFGFSPEPLTIVTPATGGDGVYTYAWMQKVEGTSVFTYIPGATTITYAPPALSKTTEYKLEVTSTCGIYESNTIQVYVRNQLSAPIIVGETDTICYNTHPEPLICTQEALGGIDDSFIYQWQESTDGKNYTDIIGENNLSYQPEALLTKHFYRLQASSNKLCGVLYSNSIEVNVFDSLQIIASTVSPICFMNSAHMEVEVTGGGSPYTFQWQQSNDSIHFTDIPDGILFEHTTTSLTNGTYYYRCIVTSTKCGLYSRMSNVIRVDVFEALSPGTIIGIDSTCYGYAPNGELTIQTFPSGVDGQYSYQWQQRTSAEWENIVDANQTTYSPTALFEPTEYRLQVASICDTLYTNSIAIKINPLPEAQYISGPKEVCYNQHEIYSIDQLKDGYTYLWYINNNHGNITTEALNTTSVDVLWKDPNQKDAVVLLITNDMTGCERSIIYDIAICNETAPDRTTIVRKPNSDILLCKEDRDIYYQWGYTDKATQVEYTIDDSNRRYVLLPSSFNNTNYDYWLTLRYDATSKCYSRSYYVEENDTIIEQIGNVVSVPSLIHGRIPIIVQNSAKEEVIIEIYTISGQLYGRQCMGNAPYIDTTLPFSLPAGVYTMRAQIGTYVETFKLIAQ